jgi:hypothetical protein
MIRKYTGLTQESIRLLPDQANIGSRRKDKE